MSRCLAVLVLICALPPIPLVVALFLWLRLPAAVVLAMMAIVAGALWMACAQAHRIARDIGQVLARAREANRECAMTRERAAAHGAMTWKAQSVEQAPALVEREGADVVVSDLAVIEEREDVIRALRAGTFGKRVAAVALSSRPTVEEYSRALAAGYDGFVAKPCDPAVLVRVLKAAAHWRPS